VQILSRYKSIWLFLAKFFGTYTLLSILYQWYISSFGTRLDTVSEFFLKVVSQVFSWVLPQITYQLQCCAPVGEVLYQGVPIVLIIEGCNALSIGILFTAFLVAFKAPLRHYYWFLPAGLLVLAVANIIRIVLLGLIYVYYPHFTDAAHDYLFPAIIYGTVFLLWVVWVKFFATNEK
jgi:exosortase family protein XrtF